MDKKVLFQVICTKSDYTSHFLVGKKYDVCIKYPLGSIKPFCIIGEQKHKNIHTWSHRMDKNSTNEKMLEKLNHEWGLKLQFEIYNPNPYLIELE